MQVPDVGTGDGYGAVDKTQAEQEKNTGCVGAAKRNPYKVFGGLLVLGAVAVAVALLVVFRTEDEEPEWKQFQEYQRSFKKSYSRDEVQERFEAFKGSLKEISRLRSLNGKATFGLNQFSDLSPEEFSEQYLGLNTDLTAKRSMPNIADPVYLGSSPSSTVKDWTADGTVTPVRDQGSCGSCWAFACTQTIESAYIRENGVSDVENFGLSVQQMVSCDERNYGCMGGWPIDAMTYVQEAGGLASSSDYPYQGWWGVNCRDEPIVEGTAPSNVQYGSLCNSYWDCSNQDEEDLAAKVETYGPMVVCVNASPWQYYTGGVLSADVCNADGNGRSVLNHAVVLTGYDISSKESYWTLKNSWSTSWGEDGYIHLEYGENTCGVMNDVIYVEL